MKKSLRNKGRKSFKIYPFTVKHTNERFFYLQHFIETIDFSVEIIVLGFQLDQLLSVVFISFSK